MRSIYDTCIIACYFNPSGNAIREANFLRFYSSLKRKEVPVYIAELCFENQSSVLSGIVENLHCVNNAPVLWQKERLLNSLILKLPQQYNKIAWVDVDLLFGMNVSNWLSKISSALNYQPVVQGFSTIYRRPKNVLSIHFPDVVEGFAYRRALNFRKGKTMSSNYHLHGHTGYAWAATRDLLEDCGLYDRCLSGSADHLMAHAYANELGTDCFRQVFGDNNAYQEHFMLWAERVASKTKGQLGYIDHLLFHLWHGNPKKRMYRKRDNELEKLKYDPGKDLKINDEGCLEWAHNGSRLQNWAVNYFDSREEPLIE